MITRFAKIQYTELSARQKENYNFQKISAVLADYGFATIRLSDDWNGADFLALHKDGETIKVQLKGRITIDDKYLGKDIWIAAPHDGGWFFYPHDQTLELIDSVSHFRHSQAWKKNKLYSWPSPSKALFQALAPHFIKGNASAA